MAAPVNAQKHVYDGVKFDSGLEVFCYKQLKSSGIAFEYNTMSFVLADSFRPDNVLIYKYNKEHGFICKNQAERGQIYTPDFVIKDGNRIFIIECKGRANERYPLMRKAFFRMMDLDNNNRYFFFEPANNKQVISTIETIMSKLNLIKNGLLLVKDNLSKKDFLLLNTLLDDRKFVDFIELTRAMLRKEKGKPREERDKMFIFNLENTIFETTEYYKQTLPQDEEDILESYDEL